MFTSISIYRALPGQADAHDDAALQCHGVFASQPGFQGRVLGRNIEDEEEYVEAVQWASPVHAKQAFAVLSQDADVRRWLGHVDVKGVRMFRMKTTGVISRSERALADMHVGSWLLVRWRTLAHVDPIAHSRNELLMHHEAFVPASGYLGALVFEEVEGAERMELIAWSTHAVAQQRVGEILGANHDLVARHMADCAPGASLHYVYPVLRA